MKRFVVILVLLAAAAFTSLACDTTALLGKQEQSAQVGEVLYRDDFSDPNSGWDTWSNAGAEVSYQDGALRFLIQDSQYDYWSRPGKRFDNVRIAVEARLVDGPQDNDYGIICRYKDQNNFYAFVISSDGYAGILKVMDGNYQMISGKSMEFKKDLRVGKAVNYIGVDCSGSQLNLYANGKQLAAAVDADFPSGEVGLIAGSYSKPGVDIRFDNFIVTKY
jgi:hypothetical protein